RYVEHDAGGSAGGPVKKDRTFFFGLVSTDRKRTGPSVRQATTITIPTPQGYAALANIPLADGQTLQSRQGVLSALSFLQDIYPQIKPSQPRPPAIINGVMIPIAAAKVPLVIPQTIWEWRGRLDHRLSTKDALTFTTQGTSINNPTRTVASPNLGFGTL